VIVNIVILYWMHTVVRCGACCSCILWCMLAGLRTVVTAVVRTAWMHTMFSFGPNGISASGYCTKRPPDVCEG
jgi:hypothetical protein